MKKMNNGFKIVYIAHIAQVWQKPKHIMPEISPENLLILYSGNMKFVNMRN